ncbi:hypothetical protein CLUG_04411 [Clavispora lusitaniae ATCC 42720]|uniref:Uncharacterized protein n=1 Tax=Clavispora lusitaniae (strain ATCC 42720) TaxID=306902 RepID=C4Y883_CLAL4|nr:uncharacterized protein CLUG_04411 [Clavispora lusitaniae ATCC 42720]EEQ40283.1 hypothetical protein CLUG_04411 [Clavispora lusitaniae ATCC 42720]
MEPNSWWYREALETMFWPAYLSSLTPTTNIGASAEGAVMTTFLAPASMCFWAPSSLVKTPVESMTNSTPSLPHGIWAESLSWWTLIFLPSMTKAPSSDETSPLELTVGGVVLEHVGGVVSSNEWVIDGNDLDVWSGEGDSQNETTNSSETVDTDSDHCV